MTGAWHGGKGPDPRPFSVTPEQFGRSHDSIDWDRRGRESRGCEGRVIHLLSDPPQLRIEGCTCGQCAPVIVKIVPLGRTK